MNRVSSVAAPTAHLVGPGKLKVINGRLAFSAPAQPALRLDFDSLESVFCYGAVSVSDEAIRELCRHGVEVAWLSAAGHRCHGRLVTDHSDRTSLRILQHRAFASAAERLEIARELVTLKINSQIAAAQHYLRQGVRVAAAARGRLQDSLRAAAAARNLDVLRGVEGAASAAWFELLGQLFRPPWQFLRRCRRPPTDPVNALLSLGYTWLLHKTEAKLRAQGLEVNLGTLHDYHPGRPSLACDLIEPFRVPTVDRWALRLCNQRQLSPADFQPPSPGVNLLPRVFPQVITTWEQHWSGGGYEHELENRLAWLIRIIRRAGGPSPDPSKPVSLRDPSGDRTTPSRATD